jgi:hypothetical protein
VAPKKRHTRVIVLIAVAVALAGLFGLAAALSVDDNEPTARSVDEPVTTDQPATTADNTPPAVAEPPAPTTTTPEAPAGPIPVGSGTWYTWDNGLEAQVTSLEQFTPDYDTTPTPDVIVTLTVKNGTGQLYDGLMATMNLYGGPNGVQAEQEYTFYGFDGSIPPGATATAKWSFTVPAEHLSDLRVEFRPGYDDSFTEYEPGYFQGSAA